MSLSKQLVENKKQISKRPTRYPFDGAVYSDSNKYFFGFSVPGLIGGMFPENMWENNEKLFSAEVPKSSKWYIVATCRFSDKKLSSVRLSLELTAPEQPEPTKASIPSLFKIILWAGYGDIKAYKIFNNNIIIKPVLLFRSYKTEVECGLSNYEDYYSVVAMS